MLTIASQIFSYPVSLVASLHLRFECGLPPVASMSSAPNVIVVHIIGARHVIDVFIGEMWLGVCVTSARPASDSRHMSETLASAS